MADLRTLFTALALATLPAATADGAAATAGGAAADGRAEGRYFVVVAADFPESARREAVETADAAWPLLRELFDVPRHGYGDKPVIRLHRTIADYQAAEYALTRGRFRANLAFSSWETWESHVALQPSLSDPALLRAGLPTLTRQQIAHEATHIVSYRAFPAYAHLPAWFAEGAACYVARRTLMSLDLADAEAGDPESAKDVLHVRRLLDAGRVPRWDAYLAGAEVDADRLAVYALQGLAFEYLMSPSHRPAFRDAIRDLRALSEPEGDPARIAEVVRATLTERRIAGLADGFRAFVDAFAPRWDMTFRSLDARDDGWYVGTIEDKNAVAWRLERLPAAFRLGGRLTIFPGETSQLNLLLNRRDDGFVQVAFHDGHVTVLEHRNHKGPDGAAWRTVARAPCPAITTGQEVPFSASADGRVLTVTVGGGEPLRASFDHDLSGPYGVGALRGSAGVFREVEVDAPR